MKAGEARLTSPNPREDAPSLQLVSTTRVEIVKENLENLRPIHPRPKRRGFLVHVDKANIEPLRKKEIKAAVSKVRKR